jgi:CRISPR-associated protein Cmr5
MLTNNQRMSRMAFQRIADRRPNKEFASFAREFPTLVHSCGLAQAVAFARAKHGHQEQYLRDLAAVLEAAGHATLGSVEQLATATREHPVSSYLRLSRDALMAAVWLKRHVEATAESSASSGGS